MTSDANEEMTKMAKIYRSWENEFGGTSAEVISDNANVLAEKPGNEHAVAFAYCAVENDGILGKDYSVLYCAKRKTGNYEWLSFCDRAPTFKTFAEAKAYAEARP